jgi:hypothetical protein
LVLKEGDTVIRWEFTRKAFFVLEELKINCFSCFLSRGI